MRKFLKSLMWVSLACVTGFVIGATGISGFAALGAVGYIMLAE